MKHTPGPWEVGYGQDPPDQVFSAGGALGIERDLHWTPQTLGAVRAEIEARQAA